MTKPNMQDIEKEIIRIVNGLIKHIQQTPLRKNVPYDQYTDSEAIQALLALIKKHERGIYKKGFDDAQEGNVFGAKLKEVEK